MNQNKTEAIKEQRPTDVASGAVLGSPVAWMRRWHFEKEKEYRVLNPKTGRMHLHNKFKWLPVTLTKLLDDDIPLYMWPNGGADLPPTGARQPRSGTEGVIGG